MSRDILRFTITWRPLRFLWLASLSVCSIYFYGWGAFGLLALASLDMRLHAARSAAKS